jgi:hypothetical protein
VEAADPGLVVIGCFGLGIALVCLIGVAVNGRFVEPEGKLLDAATFCFGVGVYALTVALLLPLAGFSPVTRRRWRRAFYIYPVYGLVLESAQAFRGLDPRFTEAGDPIDVVAGIVFGLTALLTAVLFAILGGQFFRRDVLDERPVLRLGIRYGVASVATSFGVGIVMSFNDGRDTGDDGNLLLAHGLGVHGIQVLPLIALLVSVSATSSQRAIVHVAGTAWLAATVAALAQAMRGEAPTAMGPLNLVLVASVALVLAVAVYSLVSWRRTVSLRIT